MGDQVFVWGRDRPFVGEVVKVGILVEGEVKWRWWLHRIWRLSLRGRVCLKMGVSLTHFFGGPFPAFPLLFKFTAVSIGSCVVFFFFLEEAAGVVAVAGVAGDDGGDFGVGAGVEAGSDIDRGVSGVVAAAGFVTSAVAVFCFLTGEMVAGLVSPDFEDFFFLRVTLVHPSWSFVLGLTRALFLLVWLLADGGC